MTTKYLTLPVAAYSRTLDSLEEAKNDALKTCAQFGEDMVVVEVKFVGVYQKVSPIWDNSDPTTPPQVKPAPPLGGRTASDYGESAG